MTKRVVNPLIVCVGLTLLGCADADAPPDPTGPPTLSLIGAGGIAADLRRTVAEIRTGSQTTLSVVDTAIWAPFNADGAAVASAAEAGAAGPVGWLARDAFERDRVRSSTFVDEQGVLHELLLVADVPGPWNRVEYRRGGRVVLDYAAWWWEVSGGWALASETVTYRLAGGPDIRIGVRSRRLDIARSGVSDGLLTAGGALVGLLRPRPLAAQGFYFRECNTEWLKWGGAALLAELAWGKFARSRSPSDFKKAVAATAAAGVTLGALVDCMMDQPVQPKAL